MPFNSPERTIPFRRSAVEKVALILVTLALIDLLVTPLSPPARAQTTQYTVKGKPVSEDVYRAMVLSNQVRDLLMQNQLDKALANCQEAIKISPEAPEINCNMGTTLARMGRAKEAIPYLEKAFRLDPDLPTTVMTLGSVYQSVGRTQEAIKVLKDFQARFPKDPYAPKIKELLAILEKETANQKLSVEMGGSSANDYFSSISTTHGITKWISSKMPVKVYFAPAAAVPGYKPEYGTVAKNAFEEWSSASGGKIAFTYTDRKEQADITLTFSNDIKSVSSPAEGGEAKVYPSTNGIFKANIIVLTLNPTPEHPLSPEMMHWICLHEIGHSIGMLGHSASPEDVMYSSIPIANIDQGLSERDRNTLARLYSDDVAIKMPPPPPKGASNSDNAMHLNNEAAADLQGGQVEAGIAKLEKAVKLKPDMTVARENLAQAYTIRAMNLCGAGKTAEAEQWFKKGMSLLQNGAASPQGANVVRSYALYLRLAKRIPEAQKLEAMLKASSAVPAR